MSSLLMHLSGAGSEDLVKEKEKSVNPEISSRLYCPSYYLSY